MIDPVIIGSATLYLGDCRDILPILGKVDAVEPMLELVRFVGPAGAGKIDWLVVGCESGPDRRPCKLEWVRDLVKQCKEANIPVFVKQLEVAKGIYPGYQVEHDPALFPPDLRVQEYPR